MNLDEALAGLRALNMQFPEMEQDAQRRKQNEAMRLRAAQTGAFGGQFDPMAGTQGMGVGANVADRAAAKAAYAQQIASQTPQAPRGDVWGIGGRKYPPIAPATTGDYPMVRKDDFSREMGALGLADRQKEMIASGKWDPGQTAYGSTVTVKDPNAPGTYPRDQQTRIRVQGNQDYTPEERDAYANTLVDRGLRTRNKLAAKALGIDLGDMDGMSRNELKNQSSELQRKQREATVARYDQRRQANAQNQMLASIPPGDRARYFATATGMAQERENAAADRASKEKIEKGKNETDLAVAGVKGQPLSREDAIIAISVKKNIPMREAAREYDDMKAPATTLSQTAPGFSGAKADPAGFQSYLQNNPNVAGNAALMDEAMNRFGITKTALRSMAAATQPGIFGSKGGRAALGVSAFGIPQAMQKLFSAISPLSKEKDRQSDELRVLLGKASDLYGQ